MSASEDCPERQKTKRQGRLKKKLQERADLEKQKQVDRNRKRTAGSAISGSPAGRPPGWRRSEAPGLH